MGAETHMHSQAEAAPEAEEPSTPVALKKGAWSKEEDEKLIRAVEEYGSRNWVSIEKYSGLGRPAKNCRLRWLNYLRPNLKKYPFTDEEERLILQLHAQYGNSWSRIAAKLPGRSDNEIKNFWHKRAKKCHKHHLPIYPPNIDNDANVAPPAPQPSPSTTGTLSADQTPRASTPTSTQNVLGLSETPVLIPNTAAAMSMQTSPMWQCGAPSHAFMPIREAPILSFPQGRIKQFFTDDHNHFNPLGQSMVGPDSSMPMPWSSSAMESTGSTQKFALPCGVPPVNSSSQISTQITDAPVALFSGVQLQTRPPTSPPSESCSRSNIPISNSTVALNSTASVPLFPQQLKQSRSSQELAPAVQPTKSTVQLNSSTASVSISPAQLKRSSSSRDLPTTQAMNVDNNHTVPLTDSFPRRDTPLPLIQFGTAHSSAHKLESDKKLLNELIEAEARVRFLKKRLKIRRLSTEESFFIKFTEEYDSCCREMRTEDSTDKSSSQSTTKESLSRTSSRTNNSYTDSLRSNAPTKNSSIEEMHTEALRKCDVIETSKTAILQDMQKLEKGEDSEGGERTEGSIGSEHVMDNENPDTKTFQEEDLTMKSSTTSQDHRLPTTLFDHVNSQSSISATNSDCWDTKPCLFQFPINESMEACSSIGDLFSQYSTSLQDSLLEGDMFGPWSGLEHPWYYQRHAPLIEASGPVYSQSTTNILEKPGNERTQIAYFQSDGGNIDDSLRPEFSDVAERKFIDTGFVHADLLAKSLACQSNLLQQCPANLQESNYPVRDQIMGGEQLNLAQPPKLCESSLPSNQYPETRQLDSGYLVSKQAIEQEFPGGKQAFIQTSDSGKSANMLKFSSSTWLRHQHGAANVEGFQYLVTDFEQGYEQNSNQISPCGFPGGGMNATGCTSGETWKEEQCLDSLSMESLWPETQLVSHNQPFLTNTSESAVNQSTMNQLLEESKNWNEGSRHGNAGEIWKQEKGTRTHDLDA